MPRVAFALAALALLLAGCSSGGGDGPDVGTTPTPAGPPPPPPPPSEGSVEPAVGDTWRYVGASNESVVATMLSVNETRVRLQSVSQAPGAAEHVTVTEFDARTLAIVSVDDRKLGVVLRFDPPLPLIVPAEDHTYNGTLIAPSPIGEIRQPVTAEIRFLGLENVTVPAGTFETYRYNATVRSEGMFPFRQTSELWFSPLAEQPVKTIRDGRMQELVSYELQ